MKNYPSFFTKAIILLLFLGFYACNSPEKGNVQIPAPCDTAAIEKNFVRPESIQLHVTILVKDALKGPIEGAEVTMCRTTVRTGPNGVADFSSPCGDVRQTVTISCAGHTFNDITTTSNNFRADAVCTVSGH